MVKCGKTIHRSVFLKKCSFVLESNLVMSVICTMTTIMDSSNQIKYNRVLPITK